MSTKRIRRTWNAIEENRDTACHFAESEGSGGFTSRLTSPVVKRSASTTSGSAAADTGPLAASAAGAASLGTATRVSRIVRWTYGDIAGHVERFVRHVARNDNAL